MGKSSVAAAACKYLSDREVFPDGVTFFKARKGNDYRAFLVGLQVLGLVFVSMCSVIVSYL